MYPISEDFKDALHRSHVAIALAQVLDANGVVIYDGLPVVSGHVTVDKDADNRRTYRATIAAEPQDVMEQDVNGEWIKTGVEYPLVPDDMFDLLAPGRNEIKLWRGVRLLAGEEEGSSINETVDNWDTGTYNWTREVAGNLELRFE